MAMNRELIGRSYPPSTYKVEEGAMVKYALATNETNPRLLDPGCDGSLVAPPVFPVVYHARALGKAIGDPELSIDFRRALHGEQDMTFHRPLRAGDVVSTTPSIEDIRDKGTGETLAIRLRSVDPSGELVEETLFTLFVRGQPRGEAAGESPRKKTPAPTAHADEPLAIVPQGLDADQTFRYSDASGDKVKIHLDPEVAKKAGFPGIIGHGLCTLAFTSRAVIEGVAGGMPERLKRLAVRFALPVIPGETITTRIWPARDGAEGAYAFETRDPRGQLVISDGRAVVGR
ncbi:MAG: MaoC family dehydratase N-terminal domain-containing protein [Deltaproteobacteria bacterium]|nr:MaoC family dehydratase N-terminal domain-containing protein [Deltaproteobacteria bacterium]